jgi:hypothetical protein
MAKIALSFVDPTIILSKNDRTFALWGEIVATDKLKARFNQIGLFSDPAVASLRELMDGFILNDIVGDLTHYWDYHRYFKIAFPSIDRVIVRHADGTASSQSFVEQTFSVCTHILIKEAANCTNQERVFLWYNLCKAVRVETLSELRRTNPTATTTSNGYQQMYVHKLLEWGRALESVRDNNRTKLRSRYEIGRDKLKQNDRAKKRTAAQAEIGLCQDLGRFTSSHVKETSNNVDIIRDSLAITEFMLLPNLIVSEIKPLLNSVDLDDIVKRKLINRLCCIASMCPLSRLNFMNHMEDCIQLDPEIRGRVKTPKKQQWCVSGVMPYLQERVEWLAKLLIPYLQPQDILSVQSITRSEAAKALREANFSREDSVKILDKIVGGINLRVVPYVIPGRPVRVEEEDSRPKKKKRVSKKAKKQPNPARLRPKR